MLVTPFVCFLEKEGKKYPQVLEKYTIFKYNIQYTKMTLAWLKNDKRLVISERDSLISSFRIRLHCSEDDLILFFLIYLCYFYWEVFSMYIFNVVAAWK